MTIKLALIHKNDKSRNSYIRPMQSKLIKDCPSIKSPVIEMHFNGEKPHNLLMASMRSFMNFILMREWSYYRLIKPKFLLIVIINFIIKNTYKCLVKAEQFKKLSAIEVVHCDQHTRAWEAFIQSKAQFLIVFEDDVIFKEDSSQRISDLIDFFATHNMNTPIYIDLAGGCKLSDIQIDKLEIKHDANFRHYSKPVTNTACAYLLNRELAIIFHSILAQRPLLRFLQIDFLMNKLFIIMENEGLKTICMHADPTIFKHGSASGEYKSSLNFGR